MVEPQSSSAEEPAITGRSSQKTMPLLNIEQTRDRKQKDKEDTSVRQPEDPYDILDVIDMAETIAGRLHGNSRDQAVITRSDTMQAQTGRTLRQREHTIKMESDELDELRNITVNFADQVSCPRLGGVHKESLRRSQTRFLRGCNVDLARIS